MVGGAYYIQTQTLPLWVIIASLPYALGVTTVLFGKHLDKVDFDANNKTNTMVVLLGERALAGPASHGRAHVHQHNRVVVVGVFLPTALLVLLALPLAIWMWKIYKLS